MFEWTTAVDDTTGDCSESEFFVSEESLALPLPVCERVLPLKPLKHKVCKAHVYVMPRFMLLSSAGWR